MKILTCTILLNKYCAKKSTQMGISYTCAEIKLCSNKIVQ